MAHVPTEELDMAQQHETTYIVDGMTCGNCRRHVLEEVEAVAGVVSADVDLDSGRLTVRGDGIDPAAVRAAVDEAGYVVRA